VRAFLLALALLPFAFPAFAAEDVKITLEPEVIGIDETATLTLEVHGDGFSRLNVQPKFELDNLEELGRPSQYDDMVFANGTLSRTFRLTWQVRPLALGKARVRAIFVQVQDHEVRLPAQEIRVQQEPNRQAQQQRPPRGGAEEDDPFQQFFGHMPNPWRHEQPQQPDVFLRAEVQPAHPVVGQQVLYTIYLYTRENISAVSTEGVPGFRGFWVRDVPLPQQLPTEMIELDGRRYGRVPLLKKALFPLRPGHYQLEPATIDVTVERYDRSFFFSPAVARPEGMRLQTAAQAVDVQQLNLATQLEPREIRLGQAATLTVTVAGVGNFQGIQEPRVTAPAGITLLPPQQEGKDDLNGTAVRGVRIWRYAVVPERTGRFRLESPKVTYFDPAEARYQVATAPDLALSTLPAPAAAAAPPSSGHPVHAFSASLPACRWSPLLPWLCALPWGLVLVVALVRQRSARTGAETDEEALRMEAALRQAEGEERPRQMAVRLEEAWRELLGRRWGVPASAPPSRWRELLAARGVEAEPLAELDLLIEDLQYLRSAPQLSTTDAMRADALARSRRLLRRLA
jgi:hypothetical protein